MVAPSEKPGSRFASLIKLITVLIFFYLRWMDGGGGVGVDVNVFELLNLSVVAIDNLLSDC